MEPSSNKAKDCCIEDNITHAEIRNRPGLSSILYRIGTHGRFKEIMLSRLDSLMLEGTGEKQEDLEG